MFLRTEEVYFSALMQCTVYIFFKLAEGWRDDIPSGFIVQDAVVVSSVPAWSPTSYLPFATKQCSSATPLCNLEVWLHVIIYTFFLCSDLSFSLLKKGHYHAWTTATKLISRSAFLFLKGGWGLELPLQWRARAIAVQPLIQMHSRGNWCLSRPYKWAQ
jgi:hypothetical protein